MTPGGGAALGLPLGSLVTSDPSNSSLWAGSCVLTRPEVGRRGGRVPTCILKQCSFN